MAKQKKAKPQPKAKRDDFSSSNKKLMAERVAYRCSNPDCRILTVGPHQSPDKATRLGEAAHITAALPGGERYAPDMTQEDRKSIENGIWLCSNCHTMIDSDPDAFPVELLKQWKADAEAEAKRNLGKRPETAKNVRQFPLQAPAIPLTDFVEGSRDNEIAALRASLKKEGIVFLWGFGGMGKSETAIKLALGMEPKGGVFLMHYQNSMRDTILKLNFVGYEKHAASYTVEANLQQRMTMLEEGYRDAILIVDNFDVEGKSLADLQSEPAYQELVTGGFKLIFTTRYPVNRPEWEIRPLTPEYRLKLMRNLSQGIRASDEELLELIDAVDGHTLTLALMAKTLKASLRITPKLMLEALKNNSLEELKSRAVSSNKIRDTDHDTNHDTDRDTTQRRIEAHLATLFDLSKLDDNARTVLACATLLPDGGFEPSLFLDCLPDEQQEALERLTEINWLTLKEGLITIHPVMRQVCRITLKPKDSVCGDFLEQLWKQYDEKEYDAKKFQQMGECFAVATDTLGSRNAWYPEWSGFLFSQIGSESASLEYHQKALTLVEQYDPDNGAMLGTVWHDIGVAYGKLGNYPSSLECAKTALKVREKVLPHNHPDLARTYACVGVTYCYLGDQHEYLKYSEKALEIRKEVLPETHPELAHSYDNVGIAYNNLGAPHKALKYHSRALHIRKQILPQDHPDLAASYICIGATFNSLKNHHQALEYQEKALAIRERSLPSNHPDLATAYNNVGMTYFMLRKPKDGLTMLIKARDIRERTLPSGHPSLTRIYSNLAYAYSITGPKSASRKYSLLAEENKAKEPK